MGFDFAGAGLLEVMGYGFHQSVLPACETAHSVSEAGYEEGGGSRTRLDLYDTLVY